MTTRRRLLTSIATGTVAVAGGTGVASARWWRDDDPADEAFDLAVAQDASY